MHTEAWCRKGGGGPPYGTLLTNYLPTNQLLGPHRRDFLKPLKWIEYESITKVLLLSVYILVVVYILVIIIIITHIINDTSISTLMHNVNTV